MNLAKKSQSCVLIIKRLVLFTMPLMCASAHALTEVVDGIEWTYTVSGGKALVAGVSYSSTAVPKSTTGAITIPSSLGGKQVTSIGSSAFSGCSGLTSVTIPDSVTVIGAQAFWNCSALEYVAMPDSVTTIVDRQVVECERSSRIVTFRTDGDTVNHNLEVRNDNRNRVGVHHLTFAVSVRQFEDLICSGHTRGDFDGVLV